jgi:outer membrane protein OmpA-like peptidoglycan-associated protein
MKRSSFKSTTALVVSVSLFSPGAVIAQETVVVTCTQELLTVGTPCIDPVTGLTVLPQPVVIEGGAADTAAGSPAEAEARAVAEAAAQAEAGVDDAEDQSDDGAKVESGMITADTVTMPCDPLVPGAECVTIVETTPDAIVSEVSVVAPETEAAKATELPIVVDDSDTRTLTEDDIRSSAEEFGTDVAAAPKTKGSGLSDLEKAGLLLLGAVIVGEIINNNERVVANTGDRIVVQDENGVYQIYKDDDVLLMQPGATVRTENFSDGSSRSTVLRADGTRIVTIRDVQGRVQRRLLIDASGRESTLIDDTRAVDPVNLRDLPRYEGHYYTYDDAANREALRLALMADEERQLDRTFSLRQIREIREVRELALAIDLAPVTFETGSAAIRPAQAERLRQLGDLMSEIIARDPREMFLIEGHTDAVGSPAYNLALSDRRAETVALALTEYFHVPPESLVVQGYGEKFLKIYTLEAERQNRRVAVRRITNLLN